MISEACGTSQGKSLKRESTAEDHEPQSYSVAVESRTLMFVTSRKSVRSANPAPPKLAVYRSTDVPLKKMFFMSVGAASVIIISTGLVLFSSLTTPQLLSSMWVPSATSESGLENVVYGEIAQYIFSAVTVAPSEARGIE